MSSPSGHPFIKLKRGGYEPPRNPKQLYKLEFNQLAEICQVRLFELAVIDGPSRYTPVWSFQLNDIRTNEPAHPFIHRQRENYAVGVFAWTAAAKESDSVSSAVPRSLKG